MVSIALARSDIGLTTVPPPPEIQLPIPAPRPKEEVPPPTGVIVPIFYVTNGHAAANLYYDSAGHLYHHVEVARILADDPASERYLRAYRTRLGIAWGGSRRYCGDGSRPGSH
jgi:hypothetical protein